MAPSKYVKRRIVVGGGLASVVLGGSAIAAVRRVPTVDTTALTAALDAHRSARGGTMGLVVHDLRSDKRFSWRPFTNETLSTIKVLILVACLRRVEQRGEPFTDAQHARARRMIQESDNAATDSLLAWVGVPAVQECADLLGLTQTIVRGGGAAGGPQWWGYSTSTPADLVRVLDLLVPGDEADKPVIHAGHRAAIRDLMAGVVPDQRWGVADPPLPAAVHTETKNGWGPRQDGYRLNSLGRVTGQGRNYTMAILSRSPQGFRYGRETVNGLSQIVFDTLVDPL